MATTDAKIVPIKNNAYRIYFDIRDGSGNLVAGASDLAAYISPDGQDYVALDGTVSEVPGVIQGTYYIDITAEEMATATTAACIVITTSTSGAKTVFRVLLLGDRGFDDLAFPVTSGRGIDVTSGGAVGVDWGNVENQATTVNLAGTSVLNADTVDSVAAIADAAINSATLAAGAFDSGHLTDAFKQEVVNAVLNEILSDHLTANSAGYALHKLATGGVSVVSAVAQTNDIELVQGDSYSVSDTRAIEWTDTSSNWPDLTGASLTLILRRDGKSFSKTSGLTVVVPTGSSKKCRLEYTAAESAKVQEGVYSYSLRALTQNARTITLAKGTITVSK